MAKTRQPVVTIRWKGICMRRGRRGGMQRWQELARLAMAIAIKEENAHQEIEHQLPAVPHPIGGAQSAVVQRRRVSLEVRNVFQQI